MVAANIGITLLPELATKDRDEDSDIVYIRFQQPAPARRIVLLVRHHYTRMECIREVVGLIRKCMA